MSAPRTLEEALAQCRAMGVDLRKGGAGMSACIDLMAPFCPNGVDADITRELPRCGGAAPSAAKAAILLREAQARSVSGPPWVLLGVGVAAALGIVVFVAMD